MADKKKKQTYKRTNSNSKKTDSKSKGKSNGKKDIKVSKNETLRWVIGFLALFMILSFLPINSGWFGTHISTFLKGLFGPLCYVVPIIILIIDITWGKDHENNVAGIKYILYTLEFVFISIFIQVAVAGNEEIPIKELYSKGIELKSAGLISGLVAMAFTKTIGNIASMILAVLGIFFCTALLFGATPKDTAMAIVNYFRDLSERAKEAMDEDDEEIEDLPKEPKRRRKSEPEPELEIEPIPEPLPELPEDPLEPQKGQGYEYGQLPDDPLEPQPEPQPEQPFEEQLPEPIVQQDDEEELFLDPVEDTPYVFPPISLLTADESGVSRPNGSEVARVSRKLEEILASFNVKARVVDSTFGPTVTRYELQPETGVRVKAISNLSEDLALHLAADAVRIENIPGKAAVGIEVPNKNVTTVRLRGLIDSPIFRDNKSRLFTALGEDVAGNPVYLDIAKMPHLLVAGATGQGKSVCINSLIISLLYRNHPNDVKLILIDPKTVEFSDYKDIPHLLVPVINDPKNAAGTLNWACTEMENRYHLIQEVGARDLAGYNMAVSDDPERKPLPQIVIFIDEFADLMMTAPDDVETSVCRLAQKARAAGMHLVIGTQRPSVDVITGLIKANIPSRIALKTTSQIDSRTILDQAGADKLLGRGDMLYYPVGAMKPIRVQGAFVDGKAEVQAVTQFIKEAAHAQYDESIMKQIEQEAKLCGMKGKKAAAASEPDDDDNKQDPMFMDALEEAISCGTVSTSLLQRRLNIGYARAARIIDKMERKGYVGEFDSATKKRPILITREQFAELKLNGEQKKEDNNG